MKTKRYWKIRKILLNWIFKLKKIRFTLESRRQSSKEYWSFDRLLLERFVSGVIKGIILATILGLLDKLLLSIGVILVINSNILSDVLIGELGVAGVILGLYCSNISSIYSTRYAIFNGYQMEVVIHQNCDTTEISKLVRKLNNCKPMNQAQRAFTYIDAFAREIREIADNRFFKDMYSCNNKDRINGTFERAIGDMVILCEYPSQYRKDTKVGFKWLNENATILDFENLNDLLTRLTESTEITSKIRELFNRKNGYIFVATFKAFTELGREDKEFGKFLHWLITEGKDTEINGKTWTELDIDRSTRDSGTVHGKLDYLTALVKQYFTEVKEVRELIYNTSKGKCALCGKRITYDKMTLDHIVPLAMNGADDVSNLQCTCEACNLFKGSVLPDDFMERITEIFMYQMDKKQSKRLLWKIVHKLLNKMV